MPGLDNWTVDPLSKVKEIFDDCNGSSDWHTKVSEFFIGTKTAHKELPWLNESPLHSLKSGQLVRFRGMVQDMYDNEFFLDTYEVLNKNTGEKKIYPGRYLDIATCAQHEEILEDSALSKTGDRLCYHCISLPGENSWVKQIYEDNNRHPAVPGTSNSFNRNKRRAEEDHYPEEPMDQQTSSSNIDQSMDSENKRLCNTTINGPQNCNTSDKCDKSRQPESSATVSLSKHFPLPNMDGISCIIKLYNDESYSLNDHIEVVGILSMDPIMANNSSPSQDIMESELSTTLPPSSLVPRLHVLTSRKMGHTNPLLPSLLDQHQGNALSACIGDLIETREQLRKLLEEAALGDPLVADFLICHLLSSVYLRQDVIALGKYSLNISGINKELQEKNYGEMLYNLVQTLVTQSYFLPMTLTNMNTLNFIPTKDYTTNKLTSGLTQLGAHTHLILDETKLTAGQLDANGVRNLTSIGNMINWQKVDYDFKYHNIEQYTNIPVLIISEAKAMISSDAEICLQPGHTDVSAAFSRVENLLTPELLKRIRCYLTALRLATFSLNDNMQKMVQEDFVDSRKTVNGMSSDDLHYLLTLSRLLSQSCGETNLTKDVWRSAKILNDERKSRLPKKQEK